MEQPLILSDVCLEIVDCLHKTAPTQETGIPSIRTTDINNGRLDLQGANKVSEEVYREWTQRSEPQPGDIILAREAPVGEVGIVPPGTRVCLGQRTVQLRPDSNRIAPRYLLFLLLSQELQNRMESLAAGSTVPHLNLSDIRSLELPDLPPLPIQRRIADILGTLDDKIELNRQMNQTLEAMAQALYKHWFVDFGPFQDGEFVDSELGPIPKGWKVGRLGDYCTINRETIDKDNPPDPIRYIKISGVNWGRVEETETIPYEEAPSRAKRRVQDGDIVWSKVRPSRGSYFLCLEPKDNLIVSTGFATITPERVPFSWTYLALTTDDFVDYLTVRATGAAYPSVRLDAFKDAQFAIPDVATLERFHQNAEPIFRLQESNSQENQTLAETRDYLLPKLISGKIEVEAAEEAVEESAQEKELNARRVPLERSIAFTIDAETLQQFRSLPVLQVPKQLLKVQTQVGEIFAQANDISKAIAEQVKAAGRTGQVLSSSIISAVEQVRGYEQVFRNFDTTPFITLQRPLGSAQLEFFQGISSIAANVAADLEQIDVEAFQRVLNAEFHAKLKAEPEVYEEAEVESVLAFVADWFLKAAKKFNGSISTETLINMILTVSLALFTVHSSSKDIKALRQSIEQAVETQGEARRLELIESRRFAVTADLDLRAQPSKDSPILDTLSSNQVVELIREEEAWAYVKYTDHAEDLPMMGWVQRSHLKEL